MANTLATLDPKLVDGRLEEMAMNKENAEVAVRAPGAVVETKDLFDVSMKMLKLWAGGSITLAVKGHGYHAFDEAKFLISCVRAAEDRREITVKMHAQVARLAFEHLAITVVEPTR